MSSAYIRPQPIKNPILPDATTPDIRYWRGYRAPLLIKESNAINHIHFNPSSPHDLAFTSSTRIQILSAKTQQVTKTFARFKDTVYSGEFRHDGKLLVAGDATGLIQAFDTSTRSVLVTLKPTSHAVHVTKFHPTSLSTLLSASDDRVVRLWDLTSSEPLNEFSDHSDYIRSASFIGSSSIIASGCYDGYARLFDPRAPQGQSMVSEFYHKDPIESVLAINDSTIITAGGPMIKIWDLTAGKRIRTLGNFQKTVTCLASVEEKGFLAGSLDGHVKVFDTQDPVYPVRFGWRFGGQVLTTGISPDLRQMTAGLTSGLLAVRTRKTEPRKPAAAKTPKSGNFARMIRGREYQGEYEHQIYTPTGKPTIRLKAYEKHIKSFRWYDALDAAFTPGVGPEQALMVLGELRTLGKVGVSLANRDEDSLEPLLKWANRNVHDSRSISLIADWIGAVIDMYGELLEKSPVLRSLLDELTAKVDVQIGRAVEMEKLSGMLDLLMA